MRLRNRAILRASIDSLDKEVTLVEVIAFMQKYCKHADIGEAPYVPEGDVTTGYPPYRVCLECGLSEEGWDFRVLKKDLVYKISKDAYYKIREGITISNVPRHPNGPREEDEISDKTAILRQLLTVEQLIEDWREKRLLHFNQKREEYVSALSGTY